MSIEIVNDDYVLHGTMKLTKSQRIILGILRENSTKGTTPKEIQDKVSFTPRTVRHALRILLYQNLISSVPCLQDMRQVIYFPR